MNKLLSLVTALAAVVLPQVAQANDGLYVGGMAGVNFLNTHSAHHTHLKSKTGYTVGGVVGYHLCDNVRLEGEVSYYNNANKSVKNHGMKIDMNGRLKAWSFMANTYLDIPVDFFVTPYIGVGVGYDKLSTKFNGIKGRNDGLALNGILGATKEVDAGLFVDAQYKFHQHFVRKSTKTYNHALTLGVRKAL